MELPVPGWMLLEAGKPRFIRPDNLPCINALIHGKVGGGKTLFVKEVVRIAGALGYNTVVLDAHGEYDFLLYRRVRLEPSFLNRDMVRRLLGSEGQYTEFVVDTMLGRFDDSTLRSLLSPQQVSLLDKAMNRLNRFMEGDAGIVDLLNSYHNIRIAIDPNVAGEQIILILQSLSTYYDSLFPVRGTLVVIEEQESLSRVDTTNFISQFIFEGRKRNIYTIVVSHQSPNELSKTAWGSHTVAQFDTVIRFEDGCPYVR